MVSHDEGLRVYLAQVLRQVSEWLSRAEVQQLVVVFTGIETRQVLERWVFKVETDAAALAPGCVPAAGRPARRLPASAQPARAPHSRSPTARARARA